MLTLIVAFLCHLVSSSIVQDSPLAPWISILLYVFYNRTSSNKISSFILINISNVLVMVFQNKFLTLFNAMAKPKRFVFPLKYLLIISVTNSLIFSISFVLDNLSMKYLPNIWFKHMVFPSIFTILSFKTIPFGVWSFLPYTQFNNKPFIQILSLFGMSGLMFYISCFCSMISSFFERVFSVGIQGLLENDMKMMLIMFSTYIIIYLYGSFRLTFYNPMKMGPNIRTVSIAYAGEYSFSILGLKDFDNESINKYKELIKKEGLETLEKLFEIIRRESLNGGKIFMGSEAVIKVLIEDEDEYVNKIQQLAKEIQCTCIMMPMMVVHLEKYIKREPYLDNKLWIVDQNKVVSTQKVKSVPSVDTNIKIPGDGVINVFSTSTDDIHTRIAGVICYDADFPSIVRKAASADIILVPGSDPDHTIYHTYYAACRAIEQGSNLIRSTIHGLSLAVSCTGDILNRLEYSACKQQDLIMVTSLPSKGIKNTLYSLIGDICIPFSVINLIIATILTFSKSK